ncbi:hypothetical protein EQH57_0306 [Dictyocoela roeselum]|nr:hypothetical protein EQH57_0306 [Dictyocoela roeselum]
MLFFVVSFYFFGSVITSSASQTVEGNKQEHMEKMNTGDGNVENKDKAKKEPVQPKESYLNETQPAHSTSGGMQGAQSLATSTITKKAKDKHAVQNKNMGESGVRNPKKTKEKMMRGDKRKTLSPFLEGEGAYDEQFDFSML